MNCPKCGKKMKKGFMAGGHRVVWNPDKLNFCIPPFDNEETGRTVIIPLGLKINNVESHICKDCRITVTKY